jgi:hypothetical protein
MLALVDRKPFTKRSRRRLDRGERSDYALEVTVACTRKTFTGGLLQLKHTRAFVALLDSGNNSWGSMSQAHFEGVCEAYEDFGELERRTVRLADGEALSAPAWFCNAWIHPEGRQPDIEEPIKVPTGDGWSVFPAPCDGSTLGMLSLRQLRARLDIDFDREVFSVLIPASVAGHGNAGA